ncbi:hypothetical protein HPB52_021710 [Rhipicephalus sanguineus]|uniref:Uncharacterized protein n=1 Tax=Rhipicephalus sanguineus TaxID=34632 RepID=A0A9D4Q8K3_RHISA|nr:hypothetical protein HPB52_021710 [Rhipicephalus sanguineus]
MWQVDAFFSLTHATSRGVGVIFMNNRLRRGAHCRFDTDGRVIALDLSLDGKRTRILNVYAPVTRTLANEFYRGVRSFMLEPLQYILLGDFNCVLDTSRDIRGPGQGGCNYLARELGNIVADWELIDAWVTLHGDAFSATRASGIYGSRLDRVYVPEVFREALVTCVVVQVPSYCLNVSDRKPLLFSMQVCNGGRSPRSWRMDPTILYDEECIKYMGTEVAASVAEVDVLDPATWDRLKKRWRLISEEAGKERHARITSRMNETLRRIQIVERRGTSTQAMRDYVDAQRKVYSNLLHKRAQASRIAEELQLPNDELGNLAFAVRVGTRRNQPQRILTAQRENGSITTEPVEVRNTFRTHFERLFAQEAQLDDDDFEYRFLSFCDGLPKLRDEDTERLHSPATKDEVSQALKAMNARSAPGPDGILTAFYVCFFEILGDLLTDVVNIFITEGKKPLSFRDGRVVLLLKEGMDRRKWLFSKPATASPQRLRAAASLLAFGTVLLCPLAVKCYISEKKETTPLNVGDGGDNDWKALARSAQRRFQRQGDGILVEANYQRRRPIEVFKCKVF